jgi:TRAP-type C4-dicarboxylate transport system permease small subunit
MKRLIDGYFKLLKLAIVFFIVTMVLMVFGNVVLRYFFNSAITASEELSRWCFLWLTFTGAITAMREHTHLGVDSVVTRLGVKGKKFCYAASHLIMIGCCALFLRGSWMQTLINIDVAAPATGVSSGFYYGVGIFFSVPALVILVYDLHLMLSGRLKDEDLVRIRESEEELDEDEIRELQDEVEKEMKS